LTQPEEIFFGREGKKIEKFEILRGNFPNPKPKPKLADPIKGVGGV